LAKINFDSESLDTEIQHLKKTSRQSDYSQADIHLALNPKHRIHSKQEKLAEMTNTHFVQGTLNWISRLLAKINTNTAHIPAKKKKKKEFLPINKFKIRLFQNYNSEYVTLALN
jgi:cell division protein ZapA (FtsZ GTPase activity inhibitor)